MKIAAIVLFVLQAMGIFGALIGGSFNLSGGLVHQIAYLIGFFLPTIIGIILLVAAKKKKNKEEQ